MSPEWSWLSEPLADTGVRFEFARPGQQGALERRFKVLNLGRVRSALAAVRLARSTDAAVIVAHGPTLAAWCSLFERLLGVKARLFAHTYNFTELPGRSKRAVFAWALRRAERFVVFSTVERSIYGKAFRLPEDRFDVVLWGVQPPSVEDPETPIEQGDYVCAIGGNARDYRTLLDAAALLPHIRFVLVVRPTSLDGLTVSSNVKTHVNLSVGKTMNVLKHSRFMVLPLVGSEVPCGHVTLVAAMHLGKAFVITDSSGVYDYVRDGQNALTVPPHSPEDLAAAMERLWKDPAFARRLGENGRAFASRECTEERVAEHFRAWLVKSELAAATT